MNLRIVHFRPESKTNGMPPNQTTFNPLIVHDIEHYYDDKLPQVYTLVNRELPQRK
jgi:hypothetical protein